MTSRKPATLPRGRQQRGKPHADAATVYLLDYGMGLLQFDNDHLAYMLEENPDWTSVDGPRGEGRDEVTTTVHTLLRGAAAPALAPWLPTPDADEQKDASIYAALLGCGWGERSAIYDLLDLVEGAKCMLRLAVIGDARWKAVPSQLGAPDRHGGEPIAAWIETAYRAIVAHVVWDSPACSRVNMLPYDRSNRTVDGTRLLTNRETVASWRKLLRYRLVDSIARAFDQGPPAGTGRHYIGACPRCWRVFPKRQANTLFCSRTCASVTSVRRQRERHKLATMAETEAAAAMIVGAAKRQTRKS